MSTFFVCLAVALRNHPSDDSLFSLVKDAMTSR